MALLLDRDDALTDAKTRRLTPIDLRRLASARCQWTWRLASHADLDHRSTADRFGEPVERESSSPENVRAWPLRTG